MVEDIAYCDSSKPSQPLLDHTMNITTDPVKEGWLVKVGGKGIKRNWKKRWFVLRAEPTPSLMYFASPLDETPLGVISLDHYNTVKVHQSTFGIINATKRFSFSITVNDDTSVREYIMKPEKDDDPNTSHGICDRWARDIYNVMVHARSNGNESVIADLNAGDSSLSAVDMGVSNTSNESGFEDVTTTSTATGNASCVGRHGFSAMLHNWALCSASAGLSSDETEQLLSAERLLISIRTVTDEVLEMSDDRDFNGVMELREKITNMIKNFQQLWSVILPINSDNLSTSSSPTVTSSKKINALRSLQQVAAEDCHFLLSRLEGVLGWVRQEYQRRFELTLKDDTSVDETPTPLPEKMSPSEMFLPSKEDVLCAMSIAENALAAAEDANASAETLQRSWESALYLCRLALRARGVAFDPSVTDDDATHALDSASDAMCVAVRAFSLLESPSADNVHELYGIVIRCKHAKVDILALRECLRSGGGCHIPNETLKLASEVVKARSSDGDDFTLLKTQTLLASRMEYMLGLDSSVERVAAGVERGSALLDSIIVCGVLHMFVVVVSEDKHYLQHLSLGSVDTLLNAIEKLRLSLMATANGDEVVLNDPTIMAVEDGDGMFVEHACNLMTANSMAAGETIRSILLDPAIKIVNALSGERDTELNNNARDLTICLAEELALVPISVLPTRSNDGRLLFDQFVFSFISSPRDLVAATFDAVKPFTSVLVCNVSYGEKCERSAINPIDRMQETTSISDMLGADKIILTGENPTLDFMLAKTASNINVLHIASPIVRSDDGTVGIALVGANDGASSSLLNVADVVRGFDLSKTGITTLSLAGEYDDAGAVINMERAFTMAGSPAILLCLGSQNDQTSQNVIESVYVHLLDGMTGAGAMRSTLMEMRRIHNELWRWAFYSIVGSNSRNVLFKS